MESHVFIYDIIDSSGSWGVNLKAVMAQVDKEADSIIVHINSDGGDVVEGFAIHDYLRSLGKPITTKIEGRCYSIATVIALAGDKRVMMPNAEFMVHNPWGMIEGDAEQIEQYANWVRDAETRLINFYAKKINTPTDEIAGMMKATTFMSAEKAKEYGFITEIENNYKAVAKINIERMKELNKEDKTWLAGQFEALKSYFTKHNAIKNMVTLEVVTEGGDMPVYVDSADGEVEGKNAYLDEEMTRPVPQGVHTLNDGREITVNADGVIDSVREVAQAEADAEKKAMTEVEMQEEIAALKAELQAMTDEKEKTKAELQAKQKDFETVAQTVEKMKAMVIGEDKAPSKPAPKTFVNAAGSTNHEMIGSWAKGLMNR
jgi:ATP-dependent Clp endopeptidase proteolytic subunit ClpP